jgi:hypothetical protein
MARILAGCILMIGGVVQADSGLAGHWPLAGDCRDRSGNGNHGLNHGADLTAKGSDGNPNGAARFDGRQSWVEVKSGPSLSLGAKDFSIAAWVQTEEDLDDVLGDIVSKYDPVTRRGLNFNIKIHAGVTSSQSNYRNIEFGIDNAKIEPSWTDCGRPGNTIYVCALAVHDGHLYAGTYEHGENEAGHVYRYAGGQDWTDCGSPDRANAVFTLAVYKGRLYAGTARYNASGSALKDSLNRNPGGRVYRYEGQKRWTDCGRLGEANETFAMAVCKGKLYAIPLYSPGVFEYDGKNAWKFVGIPGGNRCMALAVWNGHLYTTGNGGAGVWRYEGGEKWTDCGRQAEETQTYSFLICEGNLHTGTWPHGSVFRYGGGTKWTSIGRLGEELEVMGMNVYNGKFYAGTLPLAQVYRHDGGDAWTLTGRLDMTPDVKYRRAWSMAVYQGRLYAGTLPTGHVWSIEAGRCVTYDHELKAGWRHLAGVREGGRLKLYVDGKLVATSLAFNPADFDISNDKPLKIGFGQHDYFNGCIRDVRIYNRALTEAEVAARHQGR